MTKKTKILATIFGVFCFLLGGTTAYFYKAKKLEISQVIANKKDLPDFSKIVEKVSPAVVIIHNKIKYRDQERTWIATGIIVSPDGEIITNAHVFDYPDGATSECHILTLRNGEYISSVLTIDKKLDLALIKISGSNLPFATFGDSSKLKVGEWVIAIGNPFGINYSVTHGIISGKNRAIPDEIVFYLQTDAPINSGNSGGPLLNMDGEVIGINTMTLMDAQNIAYSIPSNRAVQFIEDYKNAKTFGQRIKQALTFH